MWRASCCGVRLHSQNVGGVNYNSRMGIPPCPRATTKREKPFRWCAGVRRLERDGQRALQLGGPAAGGRRPALLHAAAAGQLQRSARRGAQRRPAARARLAQHLRAGGRARHAQSGDAARAVGEPGLGHTPAGGWHGAGMDTLLCSPVLISAVFVHRACSSRHDVSSGAIALALTCPVVALAGLGRAAGVRRQLWRGPAAARRVAAEPRLAARAGVCPQRPAAWVQVKLPDGLLGACMHGAKCCRSSPSAGRRTCSGAQGQGHRVGC